jgi:hypothetical protein
MVLTVEEGSGVGVHIASTSISQVRGCHSCGDEALLVP